MQAPAAHGDARHRKALKAGAKGGNGGMKLQSVSADELIPMDEAALKEF